MWSFLENAPYAVAFITGGFVTVALASRAGRRAGWTPEARAAVVAAILIGGTIGAGILPVGGHLPTFGEKSVLGAVFGATLALGFVGWRMGMGAAVFDAAIPSGPIGIAIIRAGCFLAGCCFGTPTTWSVGVRYAPGTDAFREMVAAGLVAPTAVASPAVHPVQIYDAVGCLIAAACAVAARRWFRVRLAGPLVFGGLYAVVRFATEFVRYEGLPVLGGLKPLQWALASAVVLTLTTLIVAERRAALSAAREPACPGTARALAARRTTPGTRRDGRDPFGAVALVLAGVAAFAMRVATPLETLVLAAGILVLLWTFVCRYQVIARRFAPAGAAALMFQGSGPTTTPAPGDSAWPRTYFTLGGAFASGGFLTTVGSENCNAPPTQVSHEMRSMGIELGVRRELSEGTGTSFDLGVFTGRDDISGAGASSGPSETMRFNGLRAVMTKDWRNVGVTGGLVLGAPQLDPASRLGTTNGGIGPVAGIRFGPLTSVFGEITLNDVAPAPIPGAVGRISLGFRLPDDRSYLRTGIENHSPYISLRWVTPGGFELEPTIGSGGDDGTRVRAVIRKRIGGPRAPRP